MAANVASSVRQPKGTSRAAVLEEVTIDSIHKMNVNELAAAKALLIAAQTDIGAKLTAIEGREKIAELQAAFASATDETAMIAAFKKLGYAVTKEEGGRRSQVTTGKRAKRTKEQVAEALTKLKADIMKVVREGDSSTSIYNKLEGEVNKIDFQNALLALRKEGKITTKGEKTKMTYSLPA